MRLAFAATLAAFAALAACSPNSEKTNPAVATDESRAERETGAPAMGANSFTQEQAHDHAMKAGYSDVGPMTQAADGTWQGTAMKDGASVTVVVDYQGNVTSQAGATNPSVPAATPGATPPGSTGAPAPTPDPTH